LRDLLEQAALDFGGEVVEIDLRLRRAGGDAAMRLVGGQRGRRQGA
jgi:hypothetical protein